MLFKFLEKKIVLDCFTSEPAVIEYAPIHYAIKHVPDWWKKLPVNGDDVSGGNMRFCAGMVEYYKKSIAIPAWSDFYVNFFGKDSFSWEFSDGKSNAVHHPVMQRDGFLPDYVHLKMSSPWLFKSQKGVQWVWSHPSYNYAQNNDIVSLPGITDFYYQHATHINIMFHYISEKKIFIPQGQPLVVLTPMSERKVEIVRHLVDKEEMIRLNCRSYAITFQNKYKTIMEKKDQFADCPYHTGLK